jgi:hypothetical protein
MGVLLVVILLSISASTSHTYGQGPEVEIAGMVWLDENLDGVRQTTEPLLTSEPVLVATGGRFFEQTTTDAHGWYVFRLTPGRAYHVRVIYHAPDTSERVPGLGTHQGCGNTPPLMEGERRTVHLRARAVSQEQGSPLPVENEPTDWPLPNGHFFTQTTYVLCDDGFPVTNQQGIPFWDTWQAIGPEGAGYPLSGRFAQDGVPTQVFERVTFQWQAETLEVQVRPTEAIPTPPRDATRPVHSPFYIGLPCPGEVRPPDEAQVG